MNGSSTHAARIDRGKVGNAVALAAVLALMVAAATWQVDPLHWQAPGSARVAGSLAVAVAWFGLTLLVLARRRRSSAGCTDDVDPGGLDWLVAHASQTGFAESLAKRTADALASAGRRVGVVPLAQLDRGRLERARRVLFVASTTGEGDPPDATLPFVRDLLPASLPLGSMEYGLLALGDRSYDDFCAFGHRLDGWLRANHARPLFDPIEVDNGDPGALRLWQQHLGQLGGSPEQADWERPAYSQWRIASRHRLNTGSPGGPVFELRLEPGTAGELSWRAGDIAEIGPRNAAADVDSWLLAHGVDGSSSVRMEDDTTSLREALSTHRLPASVADGGPQAVADGLVPLPHREYSIASIPPEGELRLLVRQQRHPDGRLGSGSGWLTEHAHVGAPVSLRIRGNPNFRLAGGGAPLLLVGNGTGIAGLRALLAERVSGGHRRNWLMFGERTRAHDLHFGEDLERWQSQGWIDRVDLAFSRDGDTRTYVQDMIPPVAPMLLQWVEDGAAIHVCGSLEGMAPGVDAALRNALGDACVDALIEAGRYRRDVY